MTNLSVSVENLCTVIWTWNPPEGVGPNCSLSYFSHFGNKQDKVSFPEHIALISKVNSELGPRMSQILILLQSGSFILGYIQILIGQITEATVDKIEHLKIFPNYLIIKCY